MAAPHVSGVRPGCSSPPRMHFTKPFSIEHACLQAFDKEAYGFANRQNPLSAPRQVARLDPHVHAPAMIARRARKDQKTFPGVHGEVATAMFDARDVKPGFTQELPSANNFMKSPEQREAAENLSQRCFSSSCTSDPRGQLHLTCVNEGLPNCDRSTVRKSRRPAIVSIDIF